MSDIVFNEEYFKGRFLNDDKRVACFKSECKFIKNHIRRGNLLDVGCSTGEMVKSFNWAGDCYGMEISEFAKTQAKNHGVKFSKDIFNSENFFDLIVFRGTIQHIDEPFLYMKQCHSSLKKGGKVAFLATPNTNSIYFKIWSTLPFLDYPKTNYYIPNDKWIENAMKNYGFRLIDKRYPYIRSPYSNPVKDHIMFVTKLLGFNVKFPFWRNSMDLIFEKELL